MARTRKIDEAPLDVGMYELDVDCVTDIESQKAPDESPIGVRALDPDPGSLLGRTGHSAVESLADSGREKLRCR
jgi:hypothetical protein